MKRSQRQIAVVRMSVLVALLGIFGLLGVFSPAAFAQNPVPFVNQPLVPDDAPPGGPEFVLTVNGTGFVSDSVVNWNGSALATQFISGSQLRATVPAADIATASTASVTVVSPAPGGGTSNVAFFAVSAPSSGVAFGHPSYLPVGKQPYQPYSLTVGDFNGDGKLDLAVVNAGDNTIFILLGDGAGNFTLASSPATGDYPDSVAVGDFNGDGKLDLAVANFSDNTISILLGDGAGNFTLASSPATGNAPCSVAVGDFNGDGKLDLTVVNQNDNTLSILLGDGTGNFTLASSLPTGTYPNSVAVGDFNGDGKLDLAVTDGYFEGRVSIFLGDGTGGFTLASSAPTGPSAGSLAVGDFNGDGKLDLAVANYVSNSVSILLGDGTGYFTLASSLPTANYPASVAVGDFNGDGKLDLAVANYVGSSVSILLGDGAGNFGLAALAAPAGAPSSVAVGDFNGDGKLDLAVAGNIAASILPQAPTAVTLSPTSLSFGRQVAFTTSDPQTVTLTNTGSTPLSTSLGTTGDFAQTNTCGSSVATGASCTISVTFTPTAPGTRYGEITIWDDATGTLHIVTFSGTGLALGPYVTLSPTSLTFSNQPLHVTSAVRTITLTDLGTVALSVSGMAASGDFAETNTCGSSVAPGASCTISVVFTPTALGARTGTITITDNAAGSPHTVSLSGIGLLSGPNATLSPISLPFPYELIQVTSAAQAITLMNFGSAALSVTGITASGDFAEINNCGNSVASGAVCTVNVTFTPTQAGTRTGSVTVSDNALGSPQVVSLTGGGVLVENPVPFINQPLVPDATAPGGPQFTLTVNGAGFVSGSVVHWNGSALATQFISGSRLTATVPAADIATAGTASVTVVNPGMAGVPSNVVFFPVATPLTSVAFTQSDLPAGHVPTSVVTADFNGDGQPDLAVTNFGDGTVSILLGNPDGTFQPRVDYAAGAEPWGIVAGDFNGDGKQDLAVGNFSGQVSILLGNGDGSFRAPVPYQVGGDGSLLAVADFNGDGKLDLVVGTTYSNTFSILMGNGDGTFQSPVGVGEGDACYSQTLSVGDFNNDGKLDLAFVCSIGDLNGDILVYLGNGDGTFQSPQASSAEFEPQGGGSMIAADWNGDGRLDAVVFVGQEHCVENFHGCTLLYFLQGNGDGTFTLPGQYEFIGPGVGPPLFSLVPGDFNADGKLDLVAGGLLLLGNGDGSFQPPTPLPASGDFSNSVAVGDFNVDGRLDLAVARAYYVPDNTLPILLQLPAGSLVVTLSPTSLNFGTQLVSSASGPQTVTLTNKGITPLIITSLAASGDFAQTNTCGSSVAAGASCTINVTFTPAVPGTRTGTITIADNAAGGPQVVPLTGIGTAVSLSATSLTFPGQNIGTASRVQIITLTNLASTPLSLTSAAATGDFSATKLCPASIRSQGSCRISVLFKPTQAGTRTGMLTITDSDPTSPQIVSLTGTGTAPAVDLSATSLNFAGQLVGTSSAAQTVSLTNAGDGTLTISSITASGDFASTTGPCAGTVAAGASCEITVVFKPQLGGSRTGELSITDDAAGSPQTLALSGTGQDFAMSAHTTSATVTAGQTADYTLSLASHGGFSGAVSLTCPGAPAAATCSLAPSAVTLAASGTTPVTVHVTTMARSLALPATHHRPPGLSSPRVLLVLAWLVVMLLPAWTLTGFRSPKRSRLWTPLGATLLLVMLWAGCGAGGGTTGPVPVRGTPAGTYTLTVAATGSGLTNNVALTLTVN